MKKVLFTIGLLTGCLCWADVNPNEVDELIKKEVNPNEVEALIKQADANPMAYVSVAELNQLREQISNLTVRVTLLERKRIPLKAQPAEKKKKVRTASRLIITPKVQENMNILGERFPKGSIKVTKLPEFKDVKQKQKKPFEATPKIAPYVPASKEAEVVK